MPASSSSSTSCQRFSLREPGTLVCASSSTQRDLGCAREDRVEVHLLELGAAVAHRPARARPRGRRPWPRCPGPAVGLDERRRRRRCRGPRADAPRRAWRRSCPRPARRRGRCAASLVPSRHGLSRLLATDRGVRSSARLSCSTLTAGSPMKPSVAAGGVLLDQARHLGERRSAGPGDAWRLQSRVGRADVRVQTGPAAVTASGGTGLAGQPCRGRGSARSCPIA